MNRELLEQNVKNVVRSEIKKQLGEGVAINESIMGTATRVLGGINAFAVSIYGAANSIIVTGVLAAAGAPLVAIIGAGAAVMTVASLLSIVGWRLMKHAAKSIEIKQAKDMIEQIHKIAEKRDALFAKVESELNDSDKKKIEKFTNDMKKVGNRLFKFLHNSRNKASILEVSLDVGASERDYQQLVDFSVVARAGSYTTNPKFASHQARVK